MDKELKAKWVEALRSGKYKQTIATLRHSDGLGYCCLGVLLDLSGIGKWEYGVYQYITRNGEEADAEGDLCGLRGRFGIASESEVQLIALNDGDEKRQVRRHSFEEIADYIEANL